MTLAGVIVAGTLGSTAGALLLYWAGAVLGEQRLKAFADDHGRWLTLSRADIDRAGDWFDRHGGWAVFLCRLVPGLRSLISIPAGIHRMPLPAFVLYTIAGSAAWTALLVYAGYALGRNFEQVGRYLEPVTLVVIGAMALWYAWRFARHKGAPSASG
jgi:membrane protein DedA with SNARE-associated domain